MTTMIMMTPREKLASDAVTTLDVVNKNAWATSNLKFKGKVKQCLRLKWQDPMLSTLGKTQF